MSSAHHAPADRFDAAPPARVDVLAEALAEVSAPDIRIPSISFLSIQAGLIRIRLDR